MLEINVNCTWGCSINAGTYLRGGRKLGVMHWCSLGFTCFMRKWVWDLQELEQVAFSWQVGEEHHVTHIIIPLQKGGPDFCYAHNEEELFFLREELGPLPLGWIHISKCTWMTEGSSCLSLSVSLHRVSLFQVISEHIQSIVCSLSQRNIS